MALSQDHQLLSKITDQIRDLHQQNLGINVVDGNPVVNPPAEGCQIVHSALLEDHKPTGMDGDACQQDAVTVKDRNRCTIFVGNISFKVKKLQVIDFFTKFGPVQNAYLAKDPTRRRMHKGYGFITFQYEEDSKQVLEMANLTLDNRLLRVAPADYKPHPKVSLPMRFVDKAEDKIWEENIDVRSTTTTTTHSTAIASNHNDKHCKPIQRTGQRAVTTDSDETLPQLVDNPAIFNKESDAQELSTMILDENNINMLNDDIILCIFEYLSVKDKIRIERVCKRWQHLSLKTWNSLRTLGFDKIFGSFMTLGALTDTILKSILWRGCQELKSLDLSASPHLLTDWGIDVIGQRCKNLVHVNLSGVKMSNAALKRLANRCNKLQSVVLADCLSIGEKGVWYLFKDCRDLIYVDLSHNARVHGQCFHVLNENCSTLILKGCTKLADLGVGKLTTKCYQLSHLDISDCLSVTDSAIDSITSNCRNIEELHMEGFYKDVTAYGLSKLCTLSHLKKLYLVGNQSVDDTVVMAIAKGCKRLRLLNIEGCYEKVTDAGLISLEHCPVLEHLNISYLDKVGDSSISRLGMEGKLKILIARACTEITDQSVDILVIHCHDLLELDISGCDKVTNQVVELLQRNCLDMEHILTVTAGDLIQ
ncbi:putative RNA-binding protein EEED8.10 [Saccoglossus kowalevskii]